MKGRNDSTSGRDDTAAVMAVENCLRLEDGCCSSDDDREMPLTHAHDADEGDSWLEDDCHRDEESDRICQLDKMPEDESGTVGDDEAEHETVRDQRVVGEAGRPNDKEHWTSR